MEYFLLNNYTIGIQESGIIFMTEECRALNQQPFVKSLYETRALSFRWRSLTFSIGWQFERWTHEKKFMSAVKWETFSSFSRRRHWTPTKKSVYNCIDACTLFTARNVLFLSNKSFAFHLHFINREMKVFLSLRTRMWLQFQPAATYSLQLSLTLIFGSEKWHAVLHAIKGN